MKLFPRGSDFQPHPVYLSANGNLGSCPGINNGDLQTLPCNYGEGNWKDQDWKCDYASSTQPSRCINTVGQRFASAAEKKDWQLLAQDRSISCARCQYKLSVELGITSGDETIISASISRHCLILCSSPQVQNSSYPWLQRFWTDFTHLAQYQQQLQRGIGFWWGLYGQ